MILYIGIILFIIIAITNIKLVYELTGKVTLIDLFACTMFNAIVTIPLIIMYLSDNHNIILFKKK